MNGASTCDGNAADLVTSWTRDAALRLTLIERPDGSCLFYEYDAKGRLQRTKRRDDCLAASGGDRQDYVYDAEGLVTAIETYNAAGTLTATQPYTYFDSRRLARVVNPVDALDRLTEVVYTPYTGDPTTYQVFQLLWLGDRLTAYFQTNLPAATVAKRYVVTDETNRPIEMWDWPASGDTTRVWAINQNAFGYDTIVLNSGMFQPVLFAGQYQDQELTARNNSAVLHRPGFSTNAVVSGNFYDPFTGSVLTPATRRLTYTIGNPIRFPENRNGALARVVQTGNGTLDCDDSASFEMGPNGELSTTGGSCSLIGWAGWGPGADGGGGTGGCGTTGDCDPPGGGGGGSGGDGGQPNWFQGAFPWLEGPASLPVEGAPPSDEQPSNGDDFQDQLDTPPHGWKWPSPLNYPNCDRSADRKYELCKLRCADAADEALKYGGNTLTVGIEEVWCLQTCHLSTIISVRGCEG